MVRRYYLRVRQHFPHVFRDMHELYRHLFRATFKDAPYYLKFHEGIMGGSVGWFHHENWIREELIHDLDFMEQTSEEEN